MSTQILSEKNRDENNENIESTKRKGIFFFIKVLWISTSMNKIRMNKIILQNLPKTLTNIEDSFKWIMASWQRVYNLYKASNKLNLISLSMEWSGI